MLRCRARSVHRVTWFRIDRVRSQVNSYSDGTEMKVGDSVLIEHGRTPGTIGGVVVSAEHMRHWNLDKAGVMIKSAPFGLVFPPEDPVIYVSRDET